MFSISRAISREPRLIHAHKEEADEQWLYLPALKRVKRISSTHRSGSFMGSELAYEDMSAPEVERFTYRYLRDEPCRDLTCMVSERIPVDSDRATAANWSGRTGTSFASGKCSTTTARTRI